MEDAGLTVRVDAVGNTYGRWQGGDESAGDGALRCMPGQHAGRARSAAVCSAALPLPVSPPVPPQGTSLPASAQAL